MNNFARVSLVLMLSSACPAWSQWIVHDPLTLAKTLLHFKKQAEQMQQEAEHFGRQVQSLSEIGWQDTYKLEQQLRYFGSLQRRAKALAFKYKLIDQDFNRLYSTKNDSVEKKMNAWDKQTENSIRDSMKSHSVLNDSKRKMQSVSDLLKAQRRAQGNLAALQTLGELTGIMARQIEELKTIVAMDSRAKQSQLMEDRALKKAAKEYGKHVMKDFAKPRKAKRPLKRLPTLGQSAY
ncbi:MAG: hypothetical protein JKY15_06530 [Deltaproteobacteria bacterium]|nr:hypothetical protein [Deltaproteobacteria bacterium]